jgi:hypothetical protein
MQVSSVLDVKIQGHIMGLVPVEVRGSLLKLPLRLLLYVNIRVEIILFAPCDRVPVRTKIHQVQPLE